MIVSYTMRLLGIKMTVSFGKIGTTLDTLRQAKVPENHVRLDYGELQTNLKEKIM